LNNKVSRHGSDFVKESHQLLFNLGQHENFGVLLKGNHGEEKKERNKILKVKEGTCGKENQMERKIGNSGRAMRNYGYLRRKKNIKDNKYHFEF
jgi:hypothetical protein